jgi:hypothetical protein
MWLVLGILCLGLGCLALIGLLAVARELIFKRFFQADSLEEDSPEDRQTSGRCDLDRASARRYVMTR